MAVEDGEIAKAFEAKDVALGAREFWGNMKIFSGVLFAVLAFTEVLVAKSDYKDGVFDYSDELQWGLLATVTIPGALFILSKVMKARAEPAVKKANDELVGVLSRRTGLDL